jgi:hypothetical protein
MMDSDALADSSFPCFLVPYLGVASSTATTAAATAAAPIATAISTSATVATMPTAVTTMTAPIMATRVMPASVMAAINRMTGVMMMGFATGTSSDGIVGRGPISPIERHEINIMLRIDLPPARICLGLFFWFQPWRVINVTTENSLAIFSVPSGVEDMLMPELVHFGRRR